MSDRRQVTQGELLHELRLQDVEPKHVAFRCPICGTVQSVASLVAVGAGATPQEVEKYLGFSCIGRFTAAGEHQPGEPPGRGCNWTLGGLFQLHNLEVLIEGRPRPCFEPATPEEAQALRDQMAGAPQGDPCPA